MIVVAFLQHELLTPRTRPCATVLFLLMVGFVSGCGDRSDNAPPPQPVPDTSKRSADSRNVSPREAIVSDPWFSTREDAGIDFRHDSGTSPEKPFPAANGSGLAALDYDLDGRCDLYFATGTSFPIVTPRAAPINRFYRNLGAWNFEDVTAEIGLGHSGYSAGVTFGDYDSDGFPDVYVACYGANVLYRNMGDGTFEQQDATSGAADDRWATSTAMLDFDGDGFLDIYVCNYGEWSPDESRWCGDRSRNIRYYCSPRTIKPVADLLLRNSGDGSFEDATEAAGLSKSVGRSQGVVAADFDGNGKIDLYLGNDLNANSMFLNLGNGTFDDASELSGVAYDYLGGMQAGMGVDAADVNGDGLPELFVTNFEREHNAYYENLGDGQFQEVSQQRGLYAAGLPWVGWGTALADFNLNGLLDLVVTNGHVDSNRPNVAHAHPALLWQNDGKGRFEVLGAQGGHYFTQRHVGRALVVADLDNDGDQDLVIGHQDGPPSLLENEQRTPSGGGRSSIVLRLVGTRCNRDAIGSTLTLKAGERQQVLQIKGGGSYLSAHDVRKVFAVSADASSLSLEIRWPDGIVSVLDDLAPDGSYIVVQPLSSDTIARVFSRGGSK
jgi:hypothetical protein